MSATLGGPISFAARGVKRGQRCLKRRIRHSSLRQRIPPHPQVRHWREGTGGRRSRAPRPLHDPPRVGKPARTRHAERSSPSTTRPESAGSPPSPCGSSSRERSALGLDAHKRLRRSTPTTSSSSRVPRQGGPTARALVATAADKGKGRSPGRVIAIGEAGLGAPTSLSGPDQQLSDGEQASPAEIREEGEVRTERASPLSSPMPKPCGSQ